MANETMVAEKAEEKSMESPHAKNEDAADSGRTPPSDKDMTAEAKTSAAAQESESSGESQQAASEPIIIIPTIVFHIKGSFRGQTEEKPKGAFFITLNNTGAVQLCDVLVTSVKEAVIPDSQQDANTFYQKYLEFQKTAVLNSEITLPLREAFRTNLTRAKSIDFLQKIATGRNIEIEDELRAWMKDILKEEFILHVVSEVPPEEEEEEKKDILEDEFEIRLKAQFAIDPVKGKTVKQLNKGEKLVVKIVDERRTGEYLMHLLGAKKEGRENPITGEVIKAEEMPNDRYKIFVKFGPGIYGEGWIGASVKLKTILSEEEIKPPPPPTFMGVQMAITLPVFIELLAIFLIIVLLVLWGTIK